jgi:mannose-6-phosphate isomerase-like protein (cupin superfamily)
VILKSETGMTRSGSFFDLAELLQRRSRTARLYHEFLRVPAMSAGVYVLAAGAADPQKPHNEDELYYVVRGRARMKVKAAEGEQDQQVHSGSVIFVAKTVEHRFYQIEEELVALVFFAPAESE